MTARRTKSEQLGLFESIDERSMLDQLLIDSKLYKYSKDYKELLDFIIRLRNFAPFNAMLLKIQKPGLSFAAYASDWKTRFGRTIKEGARPLLILRPFGPVALVYDVMDTEGKPLPEDVTTFFACGPIDTKKMTSLINRLDNRGIKTRWIDAGDLKAGSITRQIKAIDNEEVSRYWINMNRNHSAPTQFATLAHELGHLFLGHLGLDKNLNVPERRNSTHSQAEIESESVAYLVCARNGVKCKSETYLANYVSQNTIIEDIDIYQVIRSAGQVERILGLTEGTHN